MNATEAAEIDALVARAQGECEPHDWRSDLPDELLGLLAIDGAVETLPDEGSQKRIELDLETALTKFEQSDVIQIVSTACPDGCPWPVGTRLSARHLADGSVLAFDGDSDFMLVDGEYCF